MARRLKRLKPDDPITAQALRDAGFHRRLGEIVKGRLYTVRAGEFPHGLLERPAGVLFPGEPEPAAAPSTDSGEEG